jgi:hypothetical protein
VGGSIRILLPTSWPHARLGPLVLETLLDIYAMHDAATVLTNDQRNHGGSIASSRFQAFDQFLHLPDLDILLCLVGLGVTHFDRLGRFKMWM